jgi:hypothetical protein
VLLNTKVESVARDGLLKKDDLGGRVRRQRRFVVRWSDADGQEGFLYADCVLDTSGARATVGCSWNQGPRLYLHTDVLTGRVRPRRLPLPGSYGSPNRLGPGGGGAVGEAAMAADGRLSYYLPDVLGAQRSQYADRHTLVVGAGFSAITVIAALLKLRETAAATRVTWITRSAGAPYTVLENDVLPERAALAALGNRLVAAHTPGVIHLPQVTVEELRSQHPAGVEAKVRVKGCDSTDTLAVDRVVACVGYRPDTALYSELHVHTCWATDGPIQLAASLLAAGDDGGDCLAQAAPGPDLLRTEEPGFYVLGMKSYGRSSAFILRVGLEQLAAVETLLNADTP